MPVRRHTSNREFKTTSAAHYKDKVFIYGEYLHVTIKYAYQCISFTTIKPDNIINTKFDLDFCDECTKFIIPYEELYYVPNNPLLHFSVYTYQRRCAKHGIIPKGTTLCKICEENDDIKMV